MLPHSQLVPSPLRASRPAPPANCIQPSPVPPVSSPMSASFPNSWEPYGSSQQSQLIGWRRPATRPSPSPPAQTLSARWRNLHSTPRPAQPPAPAVPSTPAPPPAASPVPAPAPSARDLAAFQLAEREHRVLTRCESVRDDVRAVSNAVAQLTANLAESRKLDAAAVAGLRDDVAALHAVLAAENNTRREAASRATTAVRDSVQRTLIPLADEMKKHSRALAALQSRYEQLCKTVDHFSDPLLPGRTADAVERIERLLSERDSPPVEEQLREHLQRHTKLIESLLERKAADFDQLCAQVINARDYLLRRCCSDNTIATQDRSAEPFLPGNSQRHPFRVREQPTNYREALAAAACRQKPLPFEVASAERQRTDRIPAGSCKNHLPPMGFRRQAVNSEHIDPNDSLKQPIQQDLSRVQVRLVPSPGGKMQVPVTRDNRTSGREESLALIPAKIRVRPTAASAKSVAPDANVTDVTITELLPDTVCEDSDDTNLFVEDLRPVSRIAIMAMRRETEPLSTLHSKASGTGTEAREKVSNDRTPHEARRSRSRYRQRQEHPPAPQTRYLTRNAKRRRLLQ